MKETQQFYINHYIIISLAHTHCTVRYSIVKINDHVHGDYLAKLLRLTLLPSLYLLPN